MTQYSGLLVALCLVAGCYWSPVPGRASASRAAGQLVLAQQDGAGYRESGERTPPSQPAASRGEEMLVLATSAGPIALTANPVRVPLSFTVKAGTADNVLANRVATLGPERRLYLVLRDFGATAQPGVLYQIYLHLDKRPVRTSSWPCRREQSADCRRRAGAENPCRRANR